MTAPVLPLRPRRTTSDPLARLLDLETEVEAQMALFRRVGARLQELEAERKQIEQRLTQSPSREPRETTREG